MSDHLRSQYEQRTPTCASARVCTFAVVLGLMASLVPGVVIAQDRDPTSNRASQSRAKGMDGAPVFVYEFADFECPHCSRFALEVFPRIDSAFVKTGGVHWIFVNLPLPTHPTAWLAHEAALCAGAVADGFWAMHDEIFRRQKEWIEAADPIAAFARFARDLGIPAQPFASCTANDRVAALLLQDVIFAASSRVNGTPAFIVNNEQTVMGLKSFEEWKSILEPMIKAKKSGRD